MESIKSKLPIESPTQEDVILFLLNEFNRVKINKNIIHSIKIEEADWLEGAIAQMYCLTQNNQRNYAFVYDIQNQIPVTDIIEGSEIGVLDPHYILSANEKVRYKRCQFGVCFSHCADDPLSFTIEELEKIRSSYFAEVRLEGPETNEEIFLKLNRSIYESIFSGKEREDPILNILIDFDRLKSEIVDDIELHNQKIQNLNDKIVQVFDKIRIRRPKSIKFEATEIQINNRL